MYPARPGGFCSVHPVGPYALAAAEHCASIGLRSGLKLQLGDASPGSDKRLLWDEQKNFAEGTERLAGGIRRIRLSRILFGTDWPIETANNSIVAIRHSLRLSPAEINQIFSKLAPHFDE